MSRTGGRLNAGTRRRLPALRELLRHSEIGHGRAIRRYPGGTHVRPMRAAAVTRLALTCTDELGLRRSFGSAGEYRQVSQDFGARLLREFRGIRVA